MAFIRKVKTQSGELRFRSLTRIMDKLPTRSIIGSAHSQVELADVTALAKQRLLYARSIQAGKPPERGRLFYCC
jgi:hypothetical protein